MSQNNSAILDFFSKFPNQPFEFVIVTDINIKEHPNYYKAIFRNIKTGRFRSELIAPEMMRYKYKVGHTYAETYAAGKVTTVSGLKSALLKVKGFDYVPENLRSDTFIKAAEAVIKAHEGLNNFYNEPAPVKVLSKLGSTIPTPALSKCFSALLCVVLGNNYGTSWSAKDTALEVLIKLSKERWEYYFKHVLPSDTKILNKLQFTSQIENWIDLHRKLDILDIETSNKEVNSLIRATKKENVNLINKSAQKIITLYYG